MLVSMLIASEVLPFVEGVKSNGLVHSIAKEIAKEKGRDAS